MRIITSLLLLGLLLLGSGVSKAENTLHNEVLCNGITPEKGTKDYVMYVRNCHNVHGEEVPKPANGKPAVGKPAKIKKINCPKLLATNQIDCTGLGHKGCMLRTWEYLGCKQASKCGKKTGQEAKKCCDDRKQLPWGAGLYYNGYMRGCNPRYKLSKTDQPEFRKIPCDKMDDINCSGMGKYMCDMLGWEAAGCERKEICSKDTANTRNCCENYDRKPRDLFKEFFQARFMKRCLA